MSPPAPGIRRRRSRRMWPASIASDITDEMLAEVRKLAAAKGLANMETAARDAEALPFEAGELRSRHLPHRPAPFSRLPMFVARSGAC